MLHGKNHLMLKYSMLHLENLPFTSVLVYSLQIIMFPYVTL